MEKAKDAFLTTQSYCLFWIHLNIKQYAVNESAEKITRGEYSQVSNHQKQNEKICVTKVKPK